MYENKWCPEHNADTPHTILGSIGEICMPCLQVYFSVHERFAAWARKTFACEWCGSVEGRSRVSPAGIRNMLCDECHALNVSLVSTQEQHFACMECNHEWAIMPAGFIYNDPGAGWHQDPTQEFVNGYCNKCANQIEADRPVYGGRGHEQIEARNIEDDRG